MKRLFAALLLSMGLLVPSVALANTPIYNPQVAVDCAQGYHVEPGTTSCVPDSSQPQPTPTCRIVALQNSPGVGATVNISWASTNTTGGTITTIGSVGPKGIQGVIPIAPATTYTGTFTGPGGTGTCSITIAVMPSGGYGVSSSIGDVSATPDVGDGLFYVPTYDATAPQGYTTPTSPTSLSGGTGGGGTLNTSKGLVSCGGTGDCNICTLSSTVQNVLNFALGLSIPIAAGMFAYAGWLFFSNADNAEKRNKGKRIFRDALVGFCIALMAWLAVQTILKALAPGYANWNSFQCNSLSRPGSTAQNGTNLGGVINGNVGAPQQAPLAPVANLIYSCQSGTIAGDGYCYDNGQLTGAPALSANSIGGYSCADNYSGDLRVVNGRCLNENDQDVGPAQLVKPISIPNSQFAQLLQSGCDANGMDSTACTVAQRISLNESTGGQNCTRSPTGAVGCMQVLSTTACSLDGSIQGCGTCRNSATAGCSDVAAYISDPQINTNLGTKYINQLYQQYNGDCRLTAAAYFQGPGNVQKYGGVPPNAVNYVNKVCG